MHTLIQNLTVLTHISLFKGCEKPLLKADFVLSLLIRQYNSFLRSVLSKASPFVALPEKIPRWPFKT